MSDNDKIERKYKRVRIRLMRDKDFAALGPVMRVGTQRLEDNVPTAYTDGVNETYGRAFVDALEEAPLAFVILHETYHKMCRHLVTYRKLWEQSPKLANMATDYWINGKLDTLAKTCTTIELPRYTQALLDLLTDAQRAALAMEGKGLGSILGLLDHKYDGMTVPEIFRELKQEQEQGGGGGGGGGEGGGGFDEHGWEEGNAIPKEKMEEIRSEIERAVREGQMIAKRMGNGSLAAELGFEELLAPKVDWRAQLRDFVRSTCRKPEQSTFRRPNRRFLHQGIIMPTMQGKQIKTLGVCVDASGSMFGGAPAPFQRAMSEIEGLVKQLGIDALHLIYWDGAVCQHELYTPATVGNWLNVTRPKGGGGTDPACITPWLKEKGIKLDAAVVLTDGEVPGWGTWTVPVLWTICNKTKHVAKVGKTIHLED